MPGVADAPGESSGMLARQASEKTRRRWARGLTAERTGGVGAIRKRAMAPCRTSIPLPTPGFA